MKQRAGEKIKLTSFNDLMGISEGESSVELEISRIVPFKNHPFKVKDDEKMEALQCILAHYERGADFKFSPALLERTLVFKVKCVNLTGKKH